MRKTMLFFPLLAGVAAYGQSEATDTIPMQRLDGVTVTAHKPQVKGDEGVMAVDLPWIVRDKPVANILEALEYLPGVTHNGGRIELAGASGVTIIINGEPANMPLQNLYSLLAATPVDRLKNVEILYSAPARYRTEGAVINVVLKVPTPLDGLQGQLRAGYDQAHYASFGGGVAATYAVKEWSFDLNYGLSRTRSWSREETFSNHLLGEERILIEDDMCRIEENRSHTVFASAAWKSLQLTYNGQITPDSKRRSLSSGTLGDYTNAFRTLSPVGYHNIAFRYAAPFGMRVGGDYTHYSEHRAQSLYKEDTYRLGSDNRQRIDRYHLYLDQEHPVGEWKLNYGAEYQHSEDHSAQHYDQNESPDFDDTLREEVAGLYVGTRRSFTWGLSFNASAKGEYFRNRYRRSWHLIPQLGATYFRTPKSIFQLNLSTRRIYPAYWELHGGTSYKNDYTTLTGNPELQPSIQYDAQFNYILKQKYVATLYFQYGDNTSVQLPYQSPGSLQLVFQTVNMDFKRVEGLHLHAPFGAGYIWNATASANLFHQREKASHFHEISFDNSKWIFYGAVSNSFKFSPDCPVSLSVDLSYISPALQGIADLSHLWRVDAGAKWQFGKRRCCELVLKADDLFNKWSPTLTIDRAGQDYRMKVRDMTRQFQLTFTYRFNGFKPKSGNIDTSRFGTGG